MIWQVFHALCALGEGEGATELLGFAARQEWMADLARRAETVARLDDTTPLEPANEDLQETLRELYAASCPATTTPPSRSDPSSSQASPT